MKLAACVLVLVGLQVGIAEATVVFQRGIDRDSFERCSGGRQWLQSRRAQSLRDESLVRRAPSKPALRAELIALAEDQNASAADAAAAAADDAAAAAVMAATEIEAPGKPHSVAAAAREPRVSAESSKLQDIVARNDVPTLAEIGDDGIFAFASLLDDAPSQPEFQVRLAEEVLRVPQSGLDRAIRRRLAEIIDRALQKSGQPQRYGTLFEFDAQDRVALTQPADDAATMAARRAEAELAPLALELCVRRDNGSTEFWPPSL